MNIENAIKNKDPAVDFAKSSIVEEEKDEEKRKYIFEKEKDNIASKYPNTETRRRRFNNDYDDRYDRDDREYRRRRGYYGGFTMTRKRKSK